MATFLDAETRARHERQNLIHSVALVAAMGGVLLFTTWLIWGKAALVWTAAFLVLLVAFGARVPADAVMRMYRARPLTRLEAPRLVAIVDELALRAALPRAPSLHLVASPVPNAFATGTRSRSAIAVTEGLLQQLSLRELAGVLAHETSHIANNDLWLMSLADATSRFVQTLSLAAYAFLALNLLGLFVGAQPVTWWAIPLLYLAPALSSLIQLGLSRAREYDADLEASMLTGDPEALASALHRLEHSTGRLWEDLRLPLPGRQVAVPSLLRSHPPAEERIRRLLALDVRRAPRRLAIEEEAGRLLAGLESRGLRPRIRWSGVWY